MSTASSYRLSVHGQPKDDNYGNKLLKAGRIYRPSWDQTETVVRFLPTRNPDDSGWSPFRLSPAPRDFGDWIRMYPAVRMFGENNPLTMLLYNPHKDPSYDVHQNPCVILRDALMGAIRNKQELQGWASLDKGGQGKGKPCSPHTGVYLARVGIFRHKSKDKATEQSAPLGLAPDDKQHFLEMTESAGGALLEQLEEKNPQYAYTGGDADYNQMYLSGDVIDLTGGGFVHFYTAGHDPRSEAALQQGTAAPRQLSIGRRAEAGGGGGGGQQREVSRYATFVEKTWKGWAANLDFMEDDLLKKDIPWDRALQFYSDEEQAALLQRNDCFPANLFLYAFQNHKDWIIERTRDRDRNRMGVAMDGDTPVVQRSPVTPAEAPQNPAQPATQRAAPAQKPQGRVGGWGSTSSEEPVATAEPAASVDPTVPTATAPSASVGDVKPGIDASIAAKVPVDPRTAAAIADMEKARARANAPRPAVPERPKA